MIANNSGGMRCGVTRDSYSTVRSLTFVLPSGTTIDTAAPDAAERFAAAEPELAAGLEAIRDEIRADEELSERIRRKFAIKNTTGYRLCAFLDADEPLEIFRRLLVGSEGTLAFIAEAVFETVPLPARTTTAWIHFPGVDEAIAPVRDLVESGATRGRADGRAGPDHRRLEHGRRPRGVERAAARVGGAAGRVRRRERRRARPPRSPGRSEILASHETIRPIDFTRDPEEIELAWRVREGLHGLIGRLRPPGTSLIVEDVCVPPERIAEGAGDLQALLGEHGFLPGVAGHASAGNLHFMLTPDFAKQEDLDRYEAFMAKLVELIVGKYDGSLKAEHGTGINMAPYVEREWGERATELMWRVKRLADPDGVLAPGVVLNRDPGVHLRNLKTTPQIEESATTCVECGFCEPVCPSRNLTTTPRQRIVLRREMARQPAGSPLQRVLLEEYEYDALDTCAADGSCQLACPVGIDTGKLVKELRGDRRTERRRIGGAADGEALGRGREARAAPACGSAARWRAAPSAAEGLPGPASKALPRTTREGAAAVYLPSCTNRIFGRGRPGASLPEALVAVSARAGLPVWIPAGRRRHLLRASLELEGLRRGPPPEGERDGRAPLGVERGGRAAGRDRRRLLHPGDRDPRRGGPRRGERRAPRGHRDPRLGRLGPRSPPAPPRGHPQGRLGHRPPDLRDPPHGPGAAGSARSPAPSPTTSTSPPRRPAAASPATAASPTRS